MPKLENTDDDLPSDEDSSVGAGLAAELLDGYLAMTQRLGHVEASVSQMQEDLAALDDRQSRQLAGIDEQRIDVSDDRHVAQLSIGRQYANFVEQDLFSLAREEITFYYSQSPRREWIARLIGSMCAELFRIGCHPDLHAKSDQRRAVLGRAVEIRGRADSMGLSYHWDFYFKPGRQLDETWQQPWGRSDPAHPAKFLVAPAYVVDGTIYHRQWVYTAPRNKADLVRQGRSFQGVDHDSSQPRNAVLVRQSAIAS